MARRNHWGRPAPARIDRRMAESIALDCIGRDEALGLLRVASRRFNPRPEGIEFVFEVEVATEVEPAAVAWVLVDRVSGDAVAEDLRPVHRAIARATRRGDVAALETLFRRHPYVTAQAAAGIARQRSAAGEAAVRRLLDEREPMGLRCVLLHALGIYGPQSYELLIRGIAGDDLEYEAGRALNDLASRRDAPEWLPAFSPCGSPRPFGAL
jgi:hypothetical protein